MTDTPADSSGLDNVFERSILELGIPPCPAILDRFMTELKKDEPDFNHIADIIGTDVSLSAGLIKTANSPFFGLRFRVRSAKEALITLGLKTSSQAVAGIILRNSFPNIRNLERFWNASASVARLSGWLANNLDIHGLRADDAYTYGLFRDCGILVLLGRFPHYEKLIEVASRDTERSFTEIEETELPTNHAMVGCILSQSWWLPEEICLAIRNHHDLVAIELANSQLPMPSRRLIATAQLAEHFVQRQLGMNLTQEWAKMGNVCLQLLNLEAYQLETLYADALSIMDSEE